MKTFGPNQQWLVFRLDNTYFLRVKRKVEWEDRVRRRFNNSILWRASSVVMFGSLYVFQSGVVLLPLGMVRKRLFLLIRWMSQHAHCEMALLNVSSGYKAGELPTSAQYDRHPESGSSTSWPFWKCTNLGSQRALGSSSLW
jgi:hypothetical protein